jgi:hypothetical protein
MKEARHLLGCAGSEAHDQPAINKTPLVSAQHPPPKPHVCRAVVLPLPCCSSDTVTAIFEAVALHLRRTVAALSDLTLDCFDVALADLRPQIRELIDTEICEALYSNDEED